MERTRFRIHGLQPRPWRRWLHLVAASACLVFLASAAHAAYSVSLLSAGQPKLTVSTGQSFELDVVLVSDAAEHHDSAVFQLVFSASGLILDDFEWSSPFQTGGVDDVSIPPRNALPRKLNADTATGSALPLDTVDVLLSNLASGAENYGVGRILRMKLSVPSNYVGPETIVIRPGSVSLADGLAEIPVKTAAFELTLRPASGTATSPLTIERDAAGWLLSWRSIADTAVLQTASDPAAKNWIDWPVKPQLIGTKKELRIALQTTDPPAYFRLRFR